MPPDAAGTRPTALALAIIVAASAVTAVPGLVLLAQPAAADAPSTVAVAQGSNCYEVTPVADESRNVSAFYDYRNPDTTPNSTKFSSFGTTEYQEARQSSMFFYTGSNGTSLVVVHDELNGSGDGSTVTWNVENLPDGWEAPVQDDNYTDATGGEQDDNYDLDSDPATIDWMWGDDSNDPDSDDDGRTDGAAFRGLEHESFAEGPIVIDPGYNEEADEWGSWGRSGEDRYRMEGWRVMEGDGDVVGDLALDWPVYVHEGGCVEENPPAAAIEDPDDVDAGDTVTFDASGSDDATLGYEWDFDGDGEVDARTETPTVEHTYNESGTYEATVTTFDTYGHGETASAEVTVRNPAPDAALSATPDSADLNENVTLDASGSTDDGEIVSYEWDVDGDGEVETTTEEATVEHAYAQNGTYNATVTVVDDDGATGVASTTVTVSDAAPTAALPDPDPTRVNESVTLDASNSTDDVGIDEYRWDLDGDGEVDRNTTDPTTTATYGTVDDHSVSVTVVDTAGATDTATATVTVAEDQPPGAELSAPADATTDDQVAFDASGSTDDWEIAEYRWDFDGDGSVDATTTDAETTHAYAQNGTYDATVVVVDDAGNTANASTTITVTLRPTATLSASPDSANVSETVTLNASGSTDEDGSITTYEWTFDDGETTTTDVPTVNHSYESPGDYEPSVTVVDSDGNEDTANASVSVAGANEPPTANLSVPDSATANESVTLDASGSVDDVGILEYRWEFGDGETATTTTAETTHTYATTGNYTVTVTVEDGENETDLASAELTVEAEAGDGDDGDDGGGDDGSGGDGGDDGNDGDGDDGNDGNTGGAPPASGGGGGAGGGGGGGGSQPAPDPEPAFELGGLNATATELVAGEEATFSTRIENTGDAAGTTEVAFAVGGTTVATESVELDPGENATVSFTHRFDEAGTHTVELDGSERTEVRVLPAEPDLSVTDVSVEDDTVTTAETVHIDATVRNDGYADGTLTLELELFGEVVAVEDVTVPRGEERTVTFTRHVNAPGTYTASVAGHDVTLEVLEAGGTGPSTGDGATPSTETTTPGFTALAALLALVLLVATGAARSRRS